MHSRLAVLLGSLNLILAQSTTDGPVINTPASVPQCLPSLLQFHGGLPPYTISAIPGGQVGAAPLVELGTQSGDSYTWIANLPAGTSTTLQIRDSRGNINYSQMFTIQPNSDDSCLKSGTTPSPTTPPATGGATPPSTGPPSASTGVVSSTPPSAKPGNSSSGSASNATSTTPNATSASSNSTKAPSPFVPSTTASNTSPVSTNTSATPSSPASTANSRAPLSSPSLLAAAALAAMALFA